jgi:hypothetical protein
MPCGAPLPETSVPKMPGGGEVPAEVDPDGQPQRAGRRVRGSEHEAGLDGDGEGAPCARVRVDQVHRAEQQAGGDEGDPRPRTVLEHPEEDPPEDQLLRDDGNRRHAGEPRGGRDRAPPLDPVGADRREAGDDDDEHQHAGQRPAGDTGQCSCPGHLDDGPVFGPPHDPPVREQHQHGRRDAHDERQEPALLHRADREACDGGRDDHGPELLEQAHDQPFQRSPRTGRRGFLER